MILHVPNPQTVSLTEAASNFADLVNRAYYKGKTIVLLKNGTPVVQITPPMPAEVDQGRLPVGVGTSAAALVGRRRLVRAGDPSRACRAPAAAGCVGLILAATAVAHEHTLATLNEREFSPIPELRLFDIQPFRRT